MTKTETSLLPRLIWNFAKGAMFPMIALVLSVLIALGLGLMAAEDWDGFAKRIDLGKTAAFYVSIGLGALFAITSYRRGEFHRTQRAQILGLSFILLLWLALL
jgi:hypothetical protein